MESWNMSYDCYFTKGNQPFCHAWLEMIFGGEFRLWMNPLALGNLWFIHVNSNLRHALIYNLTKTKARDSIGIHTYRK